MVVRTPDQNHEARSLHEFRLNGVDLCLPEGLATASIREKLADGSYEADEARAVGRCVQPGFRVLELGAGLGYVGVLAALRTDPGSVLSVEANPDLIPAIRATHARNGVAGVELLHAAVVGEAAEGQTAGFRLAPAFTASRLDDLRQAGGRLVEVPLVGFHDLLRAHRPHVVLIDVEGAEAGFFNRPWRCPLRYVVMELHPRRYGAEVVKKIVDAMSAMDMTYDPATSRGKILGFRRVWAGAPDEEDQARSINPE